MMAVVLLLFLAFLIAVNVPGALGGHLVSLIAIAFIAGLMVAGLLREVADRRFR